MDRKDWESLNSLPPIPKTAAYSNDGWEYIGAALHEDPTIWSRWIRAIAAQSVSYCYECRGEGQVDNVSCDKCEGMGSVLTSLGEAMIDGLGFLERLQQRIRYRRSKNNR